MLLSSLVIGWYMVPAMMEPMRKIFVSSFGEDTAGGAMKSIMKSMLIMQLLIEPVFKFVRWIVFAGILYVLSLAFVKGQGNIYKKLFSLVAYSEIIFILMSILTMLIVYSKGIESIQGMSDLTVFKGLDYFLKDGGSNSTVVMILSNINPFSVWYIITIAFGVSVLIRLPKSKAIFIASVGWILWLLASLLQSKATEALLRVITGQN
jgi:hypothetical protein